MAGGNVVDIVERLNRCISELRLLNKQYHLDIQRFTALREVNSKKSTYILEAETQLRTQRGAILNVVLRLAQLEEEFRRGNVDMPNLDYTDRKCVDYTERNCTVSSSY